MNQTVEPDSARPRLRTGVRLQIDRTTGRGVLLSPEGILELNETAQEILTRCDGRTVLEIITELANEYETEDDSIANDVRQTLADLKRRSLVEFMV